MFKLLFLLSDNDVKTFPFEHDIVDAALTNSYLFVALSNKTVKTLTLDGNCPTEKHW